MLPAVLDVNSPRTATMPTIRNTTSIINSVLIPLIRSSQHINNLIGSILELSIILC